MFLLFSIDGMRPDALQAANTPNIDHLIATGASTMTARTVMPSVTLPCHTSMLRGVDVPRHGITSNTFAPLARPVPSLFDVAYRQGLHCGFFYNWGPLRALHEPESVAIDHYVHDAHRPEGDQRVADATVQHLAGLDFAMVYLGWTDECGHMHGWMSPEYMQAIEDADRCVGQILHAAPNPTVLLQSDHGGHGQAHGTDCDEDMIIPWILSGPAAKSSHQIQSPVRIFDTCPTIAHILGLPTAREWEGEPIHEALAEV